MNFNPDSRTFVERSGIPSFLSALRECSRSRDLSRATSLHSIALNRGFISDRFVISGLITMYSRCGGMEQAQKIFDGCSNRDVVTWTALITGYAQNGHYEEALSIYRAMQEPPNSRTFVAALSACAEMAEREPGSRRQILEQGREIHSRWLSTGDTDIYVSNTLIDMYSKSRSMIEARRVFDSIPSPDSISWNSLLRGYVDNGGSDVALELFQKRMPVDAKNSRSFVAALSACSSLARSDKTRTEELGRALHQEAIRSGCCNIFVENAAVDMYSKCGCIFEGRRLFDSMARRDVVSWTCMIQGYADNGEAHLALELFESCSLILDFPMNARLFAAALSACSTLVDDREKEADEQQRIIRIREKAKAIHSQATACNCCDIVVENKMIDLLANSGELELAREIFNTMPRRDTISWTSMLQAYADSGDDSDRVLELLHQLLQLDDHSLQPNDRTLVAALAACLNLSDRSPDQAHGLAQYLHTLALRRTQTFTAFVKNKLIETYSKLGKMNKAQAIFDEMQQPTLTSWTSIISGYTQNNQQIPALATLEQLMTLDQPLTATPLLLAALAVCAGAMDLHRCRRLHALIVRRGLEEDVALANSLIHVYSTCASVERALAVFESLREESRTVVTWTTLIGAYAAQGMARDALEMTCSMRDKGVRPNEATAVALLSACSHVGMRGWWQKLMSWINESDRASTVREYGCLVDMFARENSMKEAMEMAEELPAKTFNGNSGDTVVIWKTILGACFKSGDLKAAKAAFEKVMELNHGNNNSSSGAYILMANLLGQEHQIN